MKKARIIFCFLILFLLFGCNASYPQMATLDLTTEPTTTAKTFTSSPLEKTIQPFTNTPLPSSTITHWFTSTPKPTFTPTPTPTDNPETGEKYHCLDVAHMLESSVQLEGSLLLQSIEGSTVSYYLVNLENRDLAHAGSLVPMNEDLKGVSISPDHKRVVFVNCTDLSSTSCEITVATTAGIANTFPSQTELGQVYWLDDEQLVIKPEKAPDNTVTLINSQTGSESQVTLPLANPYYFHPRGDGYIFYSVIDPSLTRVIYFSQEGTGQVIMADVKSGKTLAQLPYLIPEWSDVFPPIIEYEDGWAPDGSQYITTSPVTYTEIYTDVPSAVELFGIQHDGEIRQLTKLTQTYQTVLIDGYQWSPDGRFIVFWLRSSTRSDIELDQLAQRLVLLDVQSGNLIDLCLSGTPGYLGSKPVWAPNSSQFAVKLYNQAGRWTIYIIDLDKGIVYPINRASDPIGWMANSP